jgi:hypothetical protein
MRFRPDFDCCSAAMSLANQEMTSLWPFVRQSNLERKAGSRNRRLDFTVEMFLVGAGSVREKTVKQEDPTVRMLIELY